MLFVFYVIEQWKYQKKSSLVDVRKYECIENEWGGLLKCDNAQMQKLCLRKYSDHESGWMIFVYSIRSCCNDLHWIDTPMIWTFFCWCYRTLKHQNTKSPDQGQLPPSTLLMSLVLTVMVAIPLIAYTTNTTITLFWILFLAITWRGNVTVVVWYKAVGLFFLNNIWKPIGG